MTNLSRAVAATLSGAFIVAGLVLPYVGGFPLAYVLMLLGVVLAVSEFVRWQSRTLDAGELVALLAAAMLILPSVLNGDTISIISFAFLITIVPIGRSLQRFARPGNSVLVGMLALAGTAVAGLTALYQVGGLHAPRATGFNSDPIWSAHAALLLGFLSLVGVTEAGPRRRAVLFLGPVIGISVVMLSGSRGPMLAVPMLFLALLIGAFGRQWRQFAVLVPVVVVMGALIVQVFPESANRVLNVGTLRELLTNGTTDDSSTNSRLAFWQAGSKAILERPLLGQRWSNRIPAAYAFLPENGAGLERADPSLVGNKHLHADILNIGVGNGVVGLVGYVLLLAFPLISAWSGPRDSQWPSRLRGAMVLALTFGFCGLTYIMIGYEFHNALFVAIAAIITGFCRDIAPEWQQKPVRQA